MPQDGSNIHLKARLAGLFWLGTIVTGVIGEVLARQAFVAQDPGGTARALMAGEGTVRLSIAANLLTNVCYIGVTVLLYELLRPVSRTLSRFGLIFGTLGLSTGFVAVMLQLVPIALLKAAWLADMPTAQHHALVYAPLFARARIFPVGMTLFGLQMATAGWLIARSSFLPRWVGVLLGAGGCIYVLGSLGIILAPAIESILVRTTMIMALIGEGTLTVWLLTRAVDDVKWRTAGTIGAGLP